MPETISPQSEHEFSVQAKANSERFGFAGEKIGNREITEEYLLHTMGKGMELVNFTEQLSEEELNEITDTLGSIMSLTGGKAFDRAFSVILAPTDAMLDEQGEPQAGHYFRPGSVMINMDAMRDPNVSYDKFFKDKFQGQDVTKLKWILAHEFGHAMDLNRISEVDRHGIDKDSANPDWQGYGNVTGSFSAFKDVEAPSSDETRPSERAELNSKEDFAETFAMRVLGKGKKEAVYPHRSAIMNKVIEEAEGEAVVGAHQVQVIKTK